MLSGWGKLEKQHFRKNWLLNISVGLNLFGLLKRTPELAAYGS
jgi:hypothetical protein